ncbi:Maph101 [Matsumuraeses phaseoli granulovirus]|uniref:Maph101 n=1 Tax=Matsumuraeses phaseoli granulovirus TaxID=2760664 RepID=A0AAE7MLG6_9BBAC|nr:Maph101 [Matsumuraeses phaseoli granulovirus]QOD40064.1 Maph101 [Matsumuraeses phaseoli granulovirus]
MNVDDNKFVNVNVYVNVDKYANGYANVDEAGRWTKRSFSRSRVYLEILKFYFLAG